QLHQQWFWYRVGNTPEQSIDTISAPTISPYLGSQGAVITYATPAFNLAVNYLLSGGPFVSPSGETADADVSEFITITNLSANPLSFHLFLYSDFRVQAP